MTHADPTNTDQWAADVLNRIRMHRRRDVEGMKSMLDDGLLDALDCLVVAPLLEAELKNSRADASPVVVTGNRPRRPLGRRQNTF